MLTFVVALMMTAVLGQEAAAPAPAVERLSPREGSPSLGPAGAHDTLVLFMDFDCPVCPRAAREMAQLVESFHGALRVELKHNPLAMHPRALDAAAASRAAQRQGKFWEYHDLLIAPGPHDRQTLLAHAKTLALDEAGFLKDLDDPELRRGILAEQEEAKRAGAEGTPGFLINGHAETGWASLPWLQGIVRAHMKK